MLRNVICLVPVLALALATQGCGDTHASLLSEMADRMEAFADLLEECKSEEDVVARHQKLKDLVQEILDLSEKARELDAPAEEETEELEKEHKVRIRASADRIRKFAGSLGKDPKVDILIREALKGSEG